MASIDLSIFGMSSI